MLHQVLTESLDWATIVLLAGLALVVASLEARRRATRQALAFYGGLATAMSFVLWGHSTQAAERWLAVFSNAVHVTAASVWLGGLIGLGVVLWHRTRRPAPPDNAGPSDNAGANTAQAVEQLGHTALIVSRFSNLALVSMVALVMAGFALAWVELGTVHALVTTTYGRLVLTKIGVVMLIAVVAAYNRFRLVPDIVADTTYAARQLTDPSLGGAASIESDLLETDPRDSDLLETRSPSLLDDPATWASEGMRHLARTVAGEALAILIVLALTSVLVNTPPARGATDGVSVANQTLPVTTPTPGSTLNLVVAPARAGTNVVHLNYSDPQGRPIDIAGPVRIEFTLPAADIGPVTRDTLPAGPGHYILDDADLSPAGTWQITVVTRTGEFEQQRTTFSVKIR